MWFYNFTIQGSDVEPAYKRILREKYIGAEVVCYNFIRGLQTKVQEEFIYLLCSRHFAYLGSAVREQFNCVALELLLN